MATQHSNLIHVKLKGSPREIGLKHGVKLKSRIRASFKFYSEKLIKNFNLDVEKLSNEYLNLIRIHLKSYYHEIVAIAEGAGMQPWQIAYLNARTEIFHQTGSGIVLNECTSLFAKERRILAQNWDWMKECESLISLIEIEREDGHQMLMLTEPGIIGKIGFNSKGLGVCLNILGGKPESLGVPVHVLLRVALDSGSIDEAYRKIRSLPFCTFSSLLLGDQSGAVLNLELAGDQVQAVGCDDKPSVHTNHYLFDVFRNRFEDETHPMHKSSLIRFEHAVNLASRKFGLEVGDMIEILQDQENGDNAICSKFSSCLHFDLGTVCSVVMDLVKRKMFITDGSPLAAKFHEFSIK